MYYAAAPRGSQKGYGRMAFRMLYQAYQAIADLMLPVRRAADVSAALLRAPCVTPLMRPWLDAAAASFEMLARAGLRHERPPYGIDRVLVGGREVAVGEETADRTPFASLLHFKKDLAVDQPRVLLVAPM